MIVDQRIKREKRIAENKCFTISNGLESIRDCLNYLLSSSYFTGEKEQVKYAYCLTEMLEEAFYEIMKEYRLTI